jgi:hypothetical protein
VIDKALLLVIFFSFPDSTALSCAKLMWEMGSKNPVKVIKGIFVRILVFSLFNA